MTLDRPDPNEGLCRQVTLAQMRSQLRIYKVPEISASLIVCSAILFIVCCGERSGQADVPVVDAANGSPIAPSVTPLLSPLTVISEEASFAGVSFRFNPQVFGKVFPQEVEESRLQEPDEMPDGVEPRHVVFTFELKKQYNEAHVTVYSAREFPRMFDKNLEMKKGIVDEFRNLSRVLAQPSLRFGGDIPFIPFRNGSQEFQAKVKLAKFANGKGIFFVTHWSTEVALVSNDHLYYVFEGLTDDGKHYVVAEMPVNAVFLPQVYQDEFEGFKERDLYDFYRKDTVAERKYRDYIASITNRLNALPGDEYQPALRHLEEIVSTLRIGE